MEQVKQFFTISIATGFVFTLFTLTLGDNLSGKIGISYLSLYLLTTLVIWSQFRENEKLKRENAIYQNIINEEIKLFKKGKNTENRAMLKYIDDYTKKELQKSVQKFVK